MLHAPIRREWKANDADGEGTYYHADGSSYKGTQRGAERLQKKSLGSPKQRTLHTKIHARTDQAKMGKGTDSVFWIT